jgi:hypothetical protein
MKLLARVLIVAVVFLALPVSTVQALSCVAPTLSKEFAESDLVVSGNVVKNVDNDNTAGTLTLQTDNVYKGLENEDVKLAIDYEADFGGTMSWAKTNQKLLVFAEVIDGKYVTPQCSGSVNLASDKEIELLYGFKNRMQFESELQQLKQDYQSQQLANVKSGAVATLLEQNRKDIQNLRLVVAILAALSAIGIVMLLILRRMRK